MRAQDATALVSINQTRPILVAFSLPQRELPAIRRALAAKATAEVVVPGLAAQAGAGDHRLHRQPGGQADRRHRRQGAAENADEVLWPGQAVEVALTVEVKQRMLSAPASAVMPAQQGMIAWVIGADNKVAPRVVTVERIVGQTVFLSSGVAAGDRVVTDGQLRLAPGTTVIIEDAAVPPHARGRGAQHQEPRLREAVATCDFPRSASVAR